MLVYHFYHEVVYLLFLKIGLLDLKKIENAAINLIGFVQDLLFTQI